MNFSLKQKLTVAFILSGIVPVAVVGFISYSKAKSELQDSNLSKVSALAESKQREIHTYFEENMHTVQSFSNNPNVRAALKRMTKSFYTIESEARGDSAKVIPSLENYYKGPFARAYQEKTGLQLDVSPLLSGLDAAARWAQFAFISENPSALGSKHEMSSSPIKTTYAKDHEELHPYLKTELERHGYYDIFLVTPDAGRVIYSVFKELDYGTSLTKGPYSKSGLANAFLGARKLKDGQTWFEDYALYTPSYDAPASFMSAPVYEQGELLGVFIVQIPLDHVTGVLASRAGLGEGGESFLVGAEDGLLRTDTYRNKDTYNVLNSFRNPEKYKITTEAMQRAKSEATAAKLEDYASQVEVGETYDGTSVLCAFRSIEVLGKKWKLFVELPEKEAFAGVVALSKLVSWLLAVACVVVGLFGWMQAASISRRFLDLAQGLNRSSNDLASASTRIASTSTELSEASTEQAASLQETVASVEEISAMVNQNAEAASKSREASALSRREAEDGRRTVGEMMEAIHGIKSSNEEILQQMETGNKEIADIVKVIGEIGEKTKVINDIVFQTKLLSFNASVEAARAGEHGKGFAVVAEEVGNLAQMSGDAAKEISGMLTSSMQKVESIVEKTTQKVDRLVDLGRDKVSLGQSTAQKCHDALERILTQVSSVNDMVTEISNASREQAQGIQEITKAVNQLDQVTQQNTVASQDSSSQAESLSVQAVDLRGLVEKLMVFINGSGSSAEHLDVDHHDADPASKTGSRRKNVISLASRKREKASAAAPAPAPAARQGGSLVEKKVVGLRDPEVPSSDDPRFEDF